MKRVVVTGMGVISPVGNTVDEFFKSLVAGTSGIGPITRFDTTDFKVKLAAEVKNFNPEEYIPKAQIRKLDLFCQYGIAAAKQAMKDSGLEIEDPSRLGVYMGSGIGGLITSFTESEKLINGGPKKVSPFYIPMLIGNLLSGNVAIEFNAQGPSLPVVSACATSANAIGEAFRAIKFGFADAIIAGGAEATIHPIAIAGFINCQALSTTNDPDTCSIPFDARREGFTMGEGAGAVILEEYEHAKSRGANIYGEIIGYGNTNDAHHITAPHPEAAGSSNAIKLALAEAGIPEDCESIYINPHGTGTPLNDAAETLAIKKALGERAYKVIISGTKSMTGHMLGAAGAAEAIVSIMALRTGLIPPTINYLEKDPACDLDYTPNVFREAFCDYALSTSLGFGGHNACLAIKAFKE